MALTIRIILILNILLNFSQTLCPPLVLPKNAEYSGVCRRRGRPGAVCTITCLPGFQRKGSTLRKCLNNRWSGMRTKCIDATKIKSRAKCPPIQLLANGSVFNSCVNKSNVGCVLLFKCIDGFELNGFPRIKCLKSGMWSATKPDCLKKVSPTTPQTTSTTKTTTPAITTTATTITTTTKTTTAAKNTTTGPSKCDRLPSSMSGFWVSKENNRECNGEPGQVCRLYCKRQMILIGPQYVYCDPETRKWSKPVPYCLYIKNIVNNH